MTSGFFLSLKFFFSQPHLHSFEDFLKTNNHFDFSINGIFEENNAQSAQNNTKMYTDTPEFVLNLQNDKHKKIFLNENKSIFSTLPNQTASKITPISILNKFRQTESKISENIVSDNFKKQKSHKVKMISALPHEENDEPVSSTLTPKKNFSQCLITPDSRSQANSMINGNICDQISSTSKEKANFIEKSSFSRVSKSKIFSMQLDDMMKGVPNTTKSQSDSYKQVTETYPDGSNYTGCALHGKKHGKGTLLLADNSRYEGDWKNNMMSGIGKLTYQDGSTAYEGGFLENKIHGHGVMTNQEAGMLIPKTQIDYKNFSTVNKRWSTFEGIFNNGKKEGVGKWKFTTGEMFTGNFSNNMVSGVGRFTSQGKIIFGIWFNNIFIKQLS